MLRHGWQRAGAWIALVVMAVGWSPTTARQEAAALDLVTPVRALVMPAYKILRLDGGQPVRWPACKGLRWAFDTSLAPSSEAVRDVHDAATHISAVTGVPLSFAGPIAIDPAVFAIPPGIDIVVGWAYPATTPMPLAGAAGLSWQRVGGTPGNLHYTGGLVALNRDISMPTGRSSFATWFSVALHEFGHDFGLDHVAAPGEIMGPGPYRAEGLGPGDRAGLALLGPGSNCGRSGYWMVDAGGAVTGFGDVGWMGNTDAGAVDIESTATGRGYWTVDHTGEVHTFGDATFRGGSPHLTPGESVTSLSRTPTGAGYWLFTSHGRAVAYGDAVHRGDMTGTPLNGPVLDSVPTPSGRGYYLVGSDGGVFSFGDATYAGSMGATRLNAPVQSLVPDPDGRGYWLVASDGGVFAFDAAFVGSTGNLRLNKPVTGMVGSATGRGYLMVAEDGGVFTFGDAPYRGSLGGNPPTNPVVAVTAMP